MTNSLFHITLIIFIFLINYLFKKKNILTNNTGQAHQSFTLKEQVPLSGGLFLLIFFYFNYDFFSFNLIFYFSLFYLIGLFADLGTVKSPSIRFFFQIIILLMMIIDWADNHKTALKTRYDQEWPPPFGQYCHSSSPGCHANNPPAYYRPEDDNARADNSAR